MSGEEEFHVKWSEFNDNLLACLRCLWEEEQFIDVTLACDGVQFKAHKLLLSASSDFFAKLLRENPCRHPIILFSDVFYKDLESILHFLYHGEVFIESSRLSHFFTLAEAMQIKGLTTDSE
ncbi:unnamed protein product, partial [Darwinula stevensoni]